MCFSGGQEGGDEEDASAEGEVDLEGGNPQIKLPAKLAVFLVSVKERDPWSMPPSPRWRKSEQSSSSSSWENRKPWNQAWTSLVVAKANNTMVFLGWRLQGLDLAAQGEEGPASLKLCDSVVAFVLCQETWTDLKPGHSKASRRVSKTCLAAAL